MATSKNVCIICGKPRITAKSHKEKVEGSVVTYTSTICPDPNCQKKVDNMLRKERQKREEIKVNFEKRAQERMRHNRVKRARAKQASK